jgi:CheY-like chemotaxis protein
MKVISVLLIEDNKDDEWLTLRVLKKTGLENVIVARDGRRALSMLLGNQETEEVASCTPDLIILDLRLPKIDGLDVLRKIRANDLTRETKVVVLTSSEDPHDMDVCQQLGVLAFLSKPLDKKTILNLDLL